MENESNTDRCNPTENYPKIDDMLSLLDEAREKCSKALKIKRKPQKDHRRTAQKWGKN